jgi:alanine racemase
VEILSADIARITNGRLEGPPDLKVRELVTDSRQISYTDGIIFIAISGKNHDGHNFVRTLYQSGIKVFLVSKITEPPDTFPGAAFIIADDTVAALQELAVFKRNAFTSTVIAITGSAGKTVVKEWLSDIAGHNRSVVRSPKSYNSQIGVPLSVWKLDKRYDLGIFEAGISRPGEMEKLRRIIRPDIGVITNIGDAHSENFPDNRSKAEEKLKLFAGATTIIYCSDQPVIRKLISDNKEFRSKRIVDWSFENTNASVFVKKSSLSQGHTDLEFIFNGTSDIFSIPFTDRASVENAVSAAVVCISLDIPSTVIRKGLAGLVSVAMRMEMRSGINNCHIIEDYYNSDPGSLGMAIEYLKAQNNRKTTLILSDFVQSGRDEADLYGEVAGLMTRTGIGRFIGIGDALVRNRHLFGSNSLFYYSTVEFLSSFNSADFRDEVILIKGARVFEFEKIGMVLEQKVHQTQLEINLDAISGNLNEFRRVLNPGTRIMAMVKAFAYGAGPSEIASLLEFHRVGYLGVAYADEGVELRNAGVTLPVMVMNPDPASAEIMIKYNLEPEIYSFLAFERFTEVASKHGLADYPVHIKIDTGMHRLGFMPEEVGIFAEKIRSMECIRIKSVFSHLAASEDPSMDSFTHRQVEVFLKAADQISNAAGYSFLRHILNSAGIARFPQYQFDMVRPGIGIYGIGRLEGLKLRPAGRFKTRISQVKTIMGGEPVGYGCADISEVTRDIAILPVGYADGLSRKMGNRNGQLFIGGRRVPIIGNVCMDMCMADITGLNAKDGDEAEIFGDNIPITEMAIRCGTIPYEILTSIPGRVKRIFYRE